MIKITKNDFILINAFFVPIICNNVITISFIKEIIASSLKIIDKIGIMISFFISIALIFYIFFRLFSVNKIALKGIVVFAIIISCIYQMFLIANIFTIKSSIYDIVNNLTMRNINSIRDTKGFIMFFFLIFLPCKLILESEIKFEVKINHTATLKNMLKILLIYVGIMILMRLFVGLVWYNMIQNIINLYQPFRIILMLFQL